MNPKHPGTLIREIHIGGICFPVFRASPDEIPGLVSDGDLLDGFVDFEHGAIYIRAGLSPSLERDAIAHEACHAFLTTTGIQELLRDRLGPRKFKGFEEILVRVATPHVAPFFGMSDTQTLRKVARKPTKRAAKKSGRRGSR